MRRNMVIVSVLAHLLILGAMVLAAERKVLRRPTAIAFTEAEKKKREKPVPPKPAEPPKPKPKPAAPKPVVEDSKPVAPTAPPPPSHGPPPVDTGLTMGNSDGPGIDIGPGHGNGAAGPGVPKPGAVAPTPKKGGPAPKRKDDEKTEEECQEDATKPEPISTSDLNDIYTSSQARVAGVEGKLSLRVTVDKDGSVSRVDVLQSVDAQLDAAVVGAVEKWRFKPATRCGKPIAGGSFVVKARFELGD